jgi:sugar lactone lactonase YvrE
MAEIHVLDASIERLVDPHAPIENIATGFTFTEGPVWHSQDRRLLFSDIPNDTLYVWTQDDGQQVFRKPSGQGNGNTFDRQGRLLTCEHANRRVSRTARDGSVETLASRYDGKRLNSPNDVICASNGDVYFSDPPYGLRQPDGSFKGQELPYCGVFRWSAADGQLTLLIDDFERPNGLALNAQETELYICDTEHHHVRVFDRSADGSLRHGRVCAQLIHGDVLGRADGMKLDVEGNLYVAGNTPEGIWVFNPGGKLIGFISVGELAANLAWGGDDWRTLYITARTSVYAVPMKIPGQPVVIR